MRTSRTLRRVTVLLTVAGVLSLAAAVSAQFRGGGNRGFFGLGGSYDPDTRNAPYDGRFTWVRLKYEVANGGYYYRCPGCPSNLPSWAHGWENGRYRSEDNLMKIMDAITAVHPRMDATNVLAMDDPELFKYPVSFMTEAGFWQLRDSEAQSLRAYMQKGGFVIFDDFRERSGLGWAQFEQNMKRVLPGAEIVEMTPSDPIFHCFFDIDSFDIIPQSYDRARPYIAGIYENNDRSKRLMAIINYNTDVSDFWEFSGDGYLPVPDSNKAYMLGVNYVIYGLTH